MVLVYITYKTGRFCGKCWCAKLSAPCESHRFDQFLQDGLPWEKPPHFTSWELIYPMIFAWQSMEIPWKKHWISVKSHETKLHIFSTLSTWYLLSNIFSLYKPVLPAFLVVKSPFLCWLPYSFRSCSWGTIWFPHLWIHLNTGESQKKTNTLGQPWLGGLCSPFFLLGRKKMDNHHYQNMWTHVDYQRLTRYKWISP